MVTTASLFLYHKTSARRTTPLDCNAVNHTSSLPVALFNFGILLVNKTTYKVQLATMFPLLWLQIEKCKYQQPFYLYYAYVNIPITTGYISRTVLQHVWQFVFFAFVMKNAACYSYSVYYLWAWGSKMTFHHLVAPLFSFSYTENHGKFQWNHC